MACYQSKEAGRNYSKKEIESAVESAVELIVDAEDLITEIRKRPAIWDINCEDYANRDIRKQKWEEIITTFLAVEDASPELRNSFGKMLQRKWKSLRDCYSRERQRVLQVKRGGQSSRRAQYIFSDQLSFLDGVMKTKVIPGFPRETLSEERFSDDEPIDQTGRGSDQIEGAEQSSPGPSCSESQTPAIVIKDGRRKRRKLARSHMDFDFIENVVKENNSNSFVQRDQHDNTDKLFLMSLVEPLQKIPEPLRFGVRLQIMQIIYGALMNSFDSCENRLDSAVVVEKVESSSL